jgi:hypothetical protein
VQAPAVPMEDIDDVEAYLEAQVEVSRLAPAAPTGPLWTTLVVTMAGRFEEPRPGG